MNWKENRFFLTSKDIQAFPQLNRAKITTYLQKLAWNRSSTIRTSSLSWGTGYTSNVYSLMSNGLVLLPQHHSRIPAIFSLNFWNLNLLLLEALFLSSKSILEEAWLLTVIRCYWEDLSPPTGDSHICSRTQSHEEQTGYKSGQSDCALRVFTTLPT